MPLLPTKDVETGFLMVTNEMSAVITNAECESCPVFRKVAKKVDAFSHYITSYWMRPGMIDQLSCYMQDNRTNNPEESWHKKLQIYMRSKNPHVAEFMGESCKSI